MRKKFVSIFALAVLTMAAARPGRADQTVTIGPSLSFNPPAVTIAPGETVTWTWAASGHSTTSDSPTGPEVWDSGVQSLGFTFSHVFTTAGTFPYYCKVHSSPAPGGTMMNGVVEVIVPGATPTPTSTFTPSPTPTPPPPTPSSSPTPAGATPPGTAIPTLGPGALAALALALAALSLALIRRTMR
jgi:plastocyanin